MVSSTQATLPLLDAVSRDLSLKCGLKFFEKGERNQIQLRENEGKIEIWRAKWERWLRVKPEETVRQMFLIWIQETLKYPLKRVEVERAIQMGEDAEKERADIVIFSDDACTDPYIIFELKKPNSSSRLEQLRPYLRWTGCFFGCWSNGNEYSHQLREEDPDTRKAPYKFRDIGRLPRQGEDLNDILKPLTFAELKPIGNMKGLIERLEHDALANAGVNAFDTSVFPKIKSDQGFLLENPPCNPFSGASNQMSLCSRRGVQGSADAQHRSPLAGRVYVTSFVC
jgi:type I restriction enzyme M protein